MRCWADPRLAELMTAGKGRLAGVGRAEDEEGALVVGALDAGTGPEAGLSGTSTGLRAVPGAGVAVDCDEFCPADAAASRRRVSLASLSRIRSI